MPDSALSAALAEAYAAAPTDSVILHTLEIGHKDFTTPIRVVRDFVAITATIETGATVDFLPFAFDLSLPDVLDRGEPEIVISIDNVAREIMAAVEAASASHELMTVTYRAFLSDDLSWPQNDPPMVMTIRHISASPLRVTARAGFPRVVDLPFPREVYTVERFPGLNR